MSTRKIFIDSIILIYANVTSSPFHTKALTTIQNLWQAGGDLWFSRQVIREYVAVVTRPQTFMQPMSSARVKSRVQFFQSQFKIADDTVAVTAELLNLLQTVVIGGKQVHDANIVATMLVNGVSNLLTHNVKDFSRYTNMISILPLESS